MFTKKKTETNYWMNYTDLLTGLAVIFMLLAVLYWNEYNESKGEINDLSNKLKMSEKQRSLLNLIDTSLKALEKESNLFKYNAKYKRYELNIDIEFAPEKSIIPPKNIKELVQAGKDLHKFIENLNTDLKKKGLNIDFAVIIEGRAAKYNNKGSAARNEEANNKSRDAVKKLSFERAYALQKLWNTNDILKKIPYCDVLVVGNGFDGMGRYANEDKNKTFIIQIIPKFKDIQ